MKLKTVKNISKWLVVIGAANWGLVGLFKFDLVDWILGSWPVLVRIVYVIIGVAGFWGIYNKLTKPSKK